MMSTCGGGQLKCKRVPDILHKLAAEGGIGSFWADAPTLQWTKAKNLSLICSPNIAACEGLLETYFMQVTLVVCSVVCSCL